MVRKTMLENSPGGVRPGHPPTEMAAGSVEPDPKEKIRAMVSFRTMEKQDQGNMEKTTVIAFFILMSTIILPAQEWGHPIDGKVLLSGTFGELRGNHYHGGLDIKPNTDGDQSIRAAADGHIREIMARGGSHGSALILQHEN